jgi:CO dehydrogenase maturation factor
MRVAVAGKGGAGKTTISATLARLAARTGHPAVAIDADSNPNLAIALGIDQRAMISSFLPPSLVNRRQDIDRALSSTLDEVLAGHASTGPDGVRLLVMGAPDHAEQGCLCSAHATVSALLADLAGLPDATIVVDLEASPEHLSRGTARYVDTLILVAEPYYRALEAVRRLADLAAELPIPRVAVVVNKVRSPADSEAIAGFCARHSLELMAEVPWSDEVVDADRLRMPLLDAAPDGPVVAAIRQLAAILQPVDVLDDALLAEPLLAGSSERA